MTLLMMLYNLTLQKCTSDTLDTNYSRVFSSFCCWTWCLNKNLTIAVKVTWLYNISVKLKVSPPLFLDCSRFLSLRTFFCHVLTASLSIDLVVPTTAVNTTTLETAVSTTGRLKYCYFVYDMKYIFFIPRSSTCVCLCVCVCVCVRTRNMF